MELAKKKHQVFRSTFGYNRPASKWRAWCPFSGTMYTFPTWDAAMKLRGCCLVNAGNLPPTQTILDPPPVRWEK